MNNSVSGILDLPKSTSVGDSPRAHCQSKYWSQLRVCSTRGACRGRSGGLSYWSRRSAAESFSQPAFP